MPALLRQPLLHFLAAGLLLFLLWNWLHPATGVSADRRVIQINRETLLEFLQYRSSAFNREYFSIQLDGMGDAERSRLIEELVREEVLYREAIELGMDRNDYVIKRRLIQKMEFLTRGFAAATDPDDRQIREYYEAHRDDYYVQPQVSFTHVFFDPSIHGKEQALELARTTLGELNRKQIGWNDALAYGDRFLYHNNYIERTPEYVASHFGAEMAATVFRLGSDDRHWTGPFASPHGWHLVLLAERQEGYHPALEAIAGSIREDAREELIQGQTDRAIAEFRSQYRIQIADLDRNGNAAGTGKPQASRTGPDHAP